MKMDFNKVLARLIPDDAERAQAATAFSQYKRKQGVFAAGNDSNMWQLDHLKGISTATWWEDEAIGAGPLRKACMRVHQMVCAAMDVERKNSVLGICKSKQRNSMGTEKHMRSTRY